MKRFGWILAATWLSATTSTTCASPKMESIVLSADGKALMLATSKKPFALVGVNLGGLSIDNKVMEEWWQTDWNRMITAITSAKAMGVNVIRITLQVPFFMTDATHMDASQMQTLANLITLAEQQGMYLDITGLGDYRATVNTAWYEDLDETGRWNAQAYFWGQIAASLKNSPSIYAYNLINEPIVPPNPVATWRNLPTDGSLWSFNPYLVKDLAGRSATQVMQQWVEKMKGAIRAQDTKHLITMGLLPFPNALPLSMLASELDIISPHIYPVKGQVSASLKVAQQFAAAGKPTVVEETSLFKAGGPEWERFLLDAMPTVTGFFGFYAGMAPEDQPIKTIADAVQQADTVEYARLIPLLQRTGPVLTPLVGFKNDALTTHLYTDDPDNELVLANDAGFVRLPNSQGSVLRWNDGDAGVLCRFHNATTTTYELTTHCSDSDVAKFADAGFAFDRAAGWVRSAPAADTSSPLYEYLSTPRTDSQVRLTANDYGMAIFGYDVALGVVGYVAP